MFVMKSDEIVNNRFWWPKSNIKEEDYNKTQTQIKSSNLLVHVTLKIYNHSVIKLPWKCKVRRTRNFFSPRKIPVIVCYFIAFHFYCVCQKIRNKNAKNVNTTQNSCKGIECISKKFWEKKTIYNGHYSAIA